MTAPLSCRSCLATSLERVIDLGLQPLANNLLRPEDLGKPEPRFPLDVWVCRDCWLMQIRETVPPVALFSQYLYFSSFSGQMLSHARDASERYILEKGLGATSLVVEVASNDGYLLKNFVATGIPAVGFEPAENIATVAREAGVETRCEFFGEASAAALAGERGRADLILGNNVFAHAPDTNDFVAGLAALLKPDGWTVLEFPYGVDMLQHTEFDTIYHEHVFYFTLHPLIGLFARHGLEIFHVEHLSIHGGSLRLFAGHARAQTQARSVPDTLAAEAAAGVASEAYYRRFGDAAERVRAELVTYLEEAQATRKRVAAYGASAKGSTLLNYVGEQAAILEFIADRSTYKQGLLSPGLHLPIVSAEELAARRPDEALLLVWNFAAEVAAQQVAYTGKGGRFAVPIPRLHFQP